MKTILVSAYAVNPNKGSEDGMGWHFICQIARFQRVIAITRENNRPAVEAFLANNTVDEADNMTFVYYDLPYWMRFWKKGGRGAMLYYLLWQMALPSFIRRQQLAFDIAHNLNFHNDWTPSFLWKLGKPFVWGPVGHHPAIPHQFLWGQYPIKEWFTDRMRWLVKKWFWYADPFLRQTKRHACAIIAMNSAAQQVLRMPERLFFTMPSVGTDDMKGPKQAHQQFRIISAGRLVPLKGFDITIKAFAAFVHSLPDNEQQNAHLTIVGSGPYRPMMDQIVAQTGLSNQVEIVEWVPRHELRHLYNHADVFFFPSHEGAGMVVAEALSCALPVICFDNCGPGEFVNDRSGIKVPYSDYDTSVSAFAEALLTLYTRPELRRLKSVSARTLFEQRFAWDNKGLILKDIYESLA